MQRNESTHVSESSFQIIYRTAKEITNTPNGQHRREKERALAAFLEAGHCVDVHQGLETPISRLASENNDAAVNLLHYTFGANIGNAVTGYAYGGHIEKVNRLLDINPRRRTYAVIGYAFAGNFVEAENEERKLGDREISCLKDSFMMIGCAGGGWDEKINELIAIPERYKGFAWDHAIWGYALSGRVEQVKKMIENHPYVKRYGSTNVKFMYGIIGAYAFGGFVQQVNELRALRPMPKYVTNHGSIWSTSCDHEASVYYAAGGHIAEVNKLLYGPSQLYKDRPLVLKVMKIYMNMGNVVEVNKLSKIYDTLCGYEAYLWPDFLTYCNDKFTSNSILRLLTLIEDTAFRKKLVKRMKREYNGHQKHCGPKYSDFIDFDRLLETANQLIVIMNRYGVDYQRASSLAENPTLRNFIDHFGLSYDQAFSILKEPGLIGFFAIWADIINADILALCASFTVRLAHEDAKGLYQASLKTRFFSQSHGQPEQENNKFKQILTSTLNAFKKH